MGRSVKLTPAQRAALVSARDHGNPTYHLRGRAQHGGFSGTRLSLYRAGMLDAESEITDLGREAITEKAK